MQRLVTAEDLKKYPELISQGVQVNQMHDFTSLEGVDQEAHHSDAKVKKPQPAPTKPVVKKPQPKPKKEKAAKKVTKKK